MTDNEEHPEFICPGCDLWQGDEPLVCGHCSHNMCPVCGEEVMTWEKCQRYGSENAHDDDLEDRRQGL